MKKAQAGTLVYRYFKVEKNRRKGALKVTKPLLETFNARFYFCSVV